MKKFISFKKFKMLGKTRYKIILFSKIYCWDFKWHGNLMKEKNKMKISKVEKGIILMIIGLILFLSFSMSIFLSEIKKVGGIKGIIVTAGKEIKEIKTKIDNHNPNLEPYDVPIEAFHKVINSVREAK